MRERRMLVPSVAAAVLNIASCVEGIAQRSFTHNDSTFLDRTFHKGYHAVFVAAPTDTVWRERLAGEPGDMSAHRHIRLQMRTLDELGVRPIGAPAAAELRIDRVAVKRFQGGYCLYAPNNWGLHRRLQLHPQWLITSELDGPLAHAVVGRVVPGGDDGMVRSFRCVSMVSHAMDPKQDTVDVRVWMADGAIGVELWEFRDSYGDALYELMIPLDKAHGLPVVVNHAPSRKWPEFPFEELGPHLLKP
ncbi:MAG: hypothetical protein IPM46_04480 [Flavobacteriales bacterium]|nr:hypothetical protein [Flavobacteriales bacterium]